MNPNHIEALKSAIESGYENTAGIVIQQNGETVYEGYFGGHTAGQAVHVYSVTKSVFSLLIGIAIDKGLIQSIDQDIRDFLPDCPVRGITLKNLLTMTAPYKGETEPYEAFFESENWMAFALDLLDGEGQAGTFRYSPIVGSHILSGILASATGQPVLAFAQENLFTPMGIHVPHNVELRTKEEHIAFGMGQNASGWAVDPQGINPASWGLCLTASDMAKIGQLFLDGGLWQGKRIVSEAWIEACVTEQSRWAGMNLAYGYLWWILDGENGVFAAMGDGGNVLYVNRAKQLVVAIAAHFMPEAKDRIGLIMEYIEPAIEK